MLRWCLFVIGALGSLITTAAAQETPRTSECLAMAATPRVDDGIVSLYAYPDGPAPRLPLCMCGGGLCPDDSVSLLSTQDNLRMGRVLAHVRPGSDLPAASNVERIKSYITTMLDNGVPVEKIAPGLSASGLPGQIGCGEPSDGCGTMDRCSGPFRANGSMSGAGWTQPTLREFLDFLDSKNITRLDIWTGDALILVQSVAICDWFIDELRRWRHKPDGDLAVGPGV